jgi:hypothetical protein
MTGPHDELDDFLRRRRLFGRPSDELEPPAELDRLVLRQAREAIEPEKPQRVFRAPAWGMPVALAATLVLAFTVILRVGAPPKAEKAQVTVQNVSRQVETPAAVAPAQTRSYAAAPSEVREDERVAANQAATAIAPAPATSADGDAVVVDLNAVAEPPLLERRADKLAESARTGAPPPFVSDDEASRYARPMGAGPAAAGPTVASAGASGPAPEWRRDSKTWLAEIERLRTEGDVARADAELAEYKRQHRAYAGAPDR